MMQYKSDDRILYQTWHNMIARCHNPNRKAYAGYGARGVSVCDEWRYSFEQFKADVGYRPSGKYSLDRIDPYGNYKPSNCRWADRETQSYNKRKKDVNAFKVPVSIQVKSSLKQHLKDRAKEEKCSLSSLVESLLKGYLDDRHKQS